MAIKEETYTSHCPVHGQLMITKRMKTIKTKNGERYRKPFFYCSKCKAYYIIVDEFPSNFKQKSIDSSGAHIYIVGKQKSVDKHIIKDDTIEIRVIPKGTKLPKKCPFCDAETQQLDFEIKSKGGGKRELRGKRCSTCNENFFAEELYKQHPECFDLKTEKKSPKIIGKEDNNNDSILNESKRETIEEPAFDAGLPFDVDSEKEKLDENDGGSDATNDAGWQSKKKKYENIYNGPEVYLEAYQVKKCIVCGQPLIGDADTAWVQCNKCKAIYCEEPYKHIFSEPVITIGKRK